MSVRMRKQQTAHQGRAFWEAAIQVQPLGPSTGACQISLGLSEKMLRHVRGDMLMKNKLWSDPERATW